MNSIFLEYCITLYFKLIPIICMDSNFSKRCLLKTINEITVESLKIWNIDKIIFRNKSDSRITNVLYWCSYTKSRVWLYWKWFGFVLLLSVMKQNPLTSDVRHMFSLNHSQSLSITPDKGKLSIFKSESFNPLQIGQFWAKLKK